MELTEISLTLFFWSLQITIFRFIAVLVWNWAYRIVNFWVSVACFEVFSIMNLVQSTKMNICFGILFGLKLQHFSNDAFQSCYDLFQVNWLVQTFVLSRKILECCLFFYLVLLSFRAPKLFRVMVSSLIAIPSSWWGMDVVSIPILKLTAVFPIAIFFKDVICVLSYRANC